MNKQKIAFIVNPNSGTRAIKTLQDAIDKYIDTSIFDTEIIYTQYQNHATEIAKQCAAKNYHTVVAVGGDGTVNEVAQGLYQTNTLLGILPKGSGNAMARICKIPRNVNKALQIINNQKIKTVDIGFVNDTLFVNNAGIGFDSFVIGQISNEKARGLKMYIKFVMKSIANYKLCKYNITCNNQTHRGKYLMVSIANGNEFGFGYKISPKAVNNDGMMDMVCIKPIKIWDWPTLFVMGFMGILHKHPKVVNMRANTFTIQVNADTQFQVDGDIRLSGTDFEIALKPLAMQVIVK